MAEHDASFRSSGDPGSAAGSERLHSERLSALVEAGIALGSELRLDELLFRIADQARAVVGATYGALGILGPTGELARFIYSGVDEETARRIGPLPEGKGVLGVVLEQAHPLRLAEISEHPRSSGFPPNHPVMHSFLGAPIIVRGTVFGRLYLAEKIGEKEFSQEDERIAMMFAAQAAVALEKTSLYEEVAARGEELGRRLAQLASLELVARLLITESTPTDEVLASVTEQARLLTGATRATLMMLDEATGELVIRHAGGEGAPELEGVRLAPGTSKSHGVIARGRPELVDDLQRDAEINDRVLDTFGNPTNGVFAPLVVRDRAIGAIAVYGNAADRPFSSDDLAILQILANQAAIAVENDRLTELLRNLAVLEERERISKELHDGVIQSIYSVGLNLQGARALLGDHPDRAAHRIEEAIDELDAVVRDVRSYIFELRPRLVEERGFEEAMLGLVRELEVNTMAATTLELAPNSGGALGTVAQSHVLQIVREILSNIARHAQPTEVRLRAESRDATFLLEVDDNGVGFDPATTSRGHGLRNMAARAQAIGAELEIVPRPGGGMRHRLRIHLE